MIQLIHQTVVIDFEVLHFDKTDDYRPKLIEFLLNRLNHIKTEYGERELTFNTLYESPLPNENGYVREYKSFRNIFEAQHSASTFMNDANLNPKASHPIWQSNDNFIDYHICNTPNNNVYGNVYIVAIWKAIIIMDEKNYNEFINKKHPEMWCI